MIKLFTGREHPMMTHMKLFFIGFLVCLSLSGVAQVKVNGLVVDSLSFKPLPNVHIKIKNKSGGTITDERGSFSIQAIPFDTLIFSSIGYHVLIFPVILDEEDVIILMREDVTYLQPVIVTGKPILSPLVKEKKEVIYRRPTPSKLVTGSGIAFDYFSREQRERRKLQKLIAANEKVFAYNEIITDPDYRDEIMQRYGFTEEEYYGAVLNFNLTQIGTIEYKRREEVMGILSKYFCNMSPKCK
ncbi:MAG TPA: carboxypeptidase-like regulatory domain-containing protein [Cyclobacteriaceae bacterium]|nr:carboxypeptidase-like regulatory domain-containing protein [Cyclobacteriaceae bacterium]